MGHHIEPVDAPVADADAIDVEWFGNDGEVGVLGGDAAGLAPVSYTHLRAHETVLDLVCRLLLEKQKKKNKKKKKNKIVHIKKDT